MKKKKKIKKLDQKFYKKIKHFKEEAYWVVLKEKIVLKI